jgi:hypothetical protein
MKVIKLEDFHDWENLPEPREITPEENTELYALA